MKLVIIDDSAIMRERIKSQALTCNDVTVVGEAGNGSDAMTVILESDPDMVILDLHMRDMGGMEVLRKIRKSGMKTCVCILTNYSYPQYKARCMELGADHFLSKSDDFEKLKSIIDSHLLTTQQS